MEANVTTPEKTTAQKVVNFVVAPPNKNIQVFIETPTGTSDVIVDISALWAGATTTQKNTIKIFFKRVGALALDAKNEADGVDVVEGDMVGDIWDD